MEISESILFDVRRLLAEILMLEIDEIHPEDSFFEVLAGESIELIELSFRLERLYGVRVRFQDLAAAATEFQLDDRGCLTPDSAVLLKGKYPFLKLDQFVSQPMQRRAEFLTIEALAGFVQMAVDANRGQGSAAPHR